MSDNEFEVGDEVEAKFAWTAEEGVQWHEAEITDVATFRGEEMEGFWVIDPESERASGLITSEDKIRKPQ